MVKCASDGEETESGEARIGEARGRGEAEAKVEVKTGCEAEASCTGETVVVLKRRGIRGASGARVGCGGDAGG